jgi:hypothetical protein
VRLTSVHRYAAGMADAQSSDDSNLDDVKRRYREALERKQGKKSEGAAADGAEERRKLTDAHGPAHTQRQFRRKSGG